MENNYIPQIVSLNSPLDNLTNTGVTTCQIKLLSPKIREARVENPQGMRGSNAVHRTNRGCCGTGGHTAGATQSSFTFAALTQISIVTLVAALYRPVALHLGVKRYLFRGRLSDILHIRHLHYDS